MVLRPMQSSNCSRPRTLSLVLGSSDLKETTVVLESTTPRHEPPTLPTQSSSPSALHFSFRKAAWSSVLVDASGPKVVGPRRSAQLTHTHEPPCGLSPREAIPFNASSTPHAPTLRLCAREGSGVYPKNNITEPDATSHCPRPRAWIKGLGQCDVASEPEISPFGPLC